MRSMDEVTGKPSHERVVLVPQASDAPGGGAVFAFTLPLRDAPGGVDEPAADDTARRRETGRQTRALHRKRTEQAAG